VSKKTKVAGNPALDCTLPDVSIELDGTTYHLCFDYASLAIAERKLNDSLVLAWRKLNDALPLDERKPFDQGTKVNMLASLDLTQMGAERLPSLFYAALVKGQPEITFAQASSLITMRTFADVFAKVAEAFVGSMSEPKAEEQTTQNPTLEPAA
jgi:hypothetical protein